MAAAIPLCHWLGNLFAAKVFYYSRRWDWDRAVHRLFARHSLRRRVIALAAAYAIALAGLLASFAGAQAAADLVGQPDGFICHHELAGQTAPSPGQADNKLCAQCCVGCVILMAALPPPPVTATALPKAAGEVLPPLVLAVPAGAPESKSHRSRAPPFAA
jgi:hypothetical protein